jgi:hypothetical protein
LSFCLSTQNAGDVVLYVVLYVPANTSFTWPNSSFLDCAEGGNATKISAATG